jgi:hypothetical protein
LTNLMDQARGGAVQAITPINDYNNAIINLLSTVENIPQDQITPIVTDISRAAQLAQVSSEEATKAFTTMNVAFGKDVNFKNIHQVAQEFFLLTKLAPGGVAAGQQVIGQLGQLAQVTRAAHGTPEDMFSLLLTTLRTGIPPAQAGRGLQYLIQTVALPGQQTKESRTALASVGITTGADLTLQQRLGRIFARARALGVRGDIGQVARLDEETLGQMEAAPGGTTGALQDLGISGQGAAFLGTIFRRIHALRTALAISGEIDVGQAQKDLKDMNDAAQGHITDLNDLNKAWGRFAKQAQLKKAAIALSAMGLQVAQTFAPIMNFAARGVTGLQGQMQAHPEATRNALLAGGSVAAALALSRGLGLRSILRGGARGIPMAGAAVGLASGQAPDGSFTRPFFVIPLAGLGNIGGGPGILGKAEQAAERGGAAGWAARLATKFPRLARFGRLAGGPVAMAAALAPLANAQGNWLDEQMGWGDADKRQAKRNIEKFGPPMTAREIQRQIARSQGVERQDARGGRQRFNFSATDALLRGRADVNITLNERDASGKTKRKTGLSVPVDLWAGGRQPGSRGQAGKTTRNN